MSDEVMILKERWKEAKGTRTFPDIAESIGMTPEAVQYAFSTKSANLSIDTVIRISRELNVSIDDICGIIVDKSRSATDLAQQDAAHWKARYDSSTKEIDYLRSVTLFLAVFVLLVTAWAVTMDLHCTDIGFYRGQWNFGTIFSLACLAAAACLVVVIVLRTFRRHRQRRREKE